MDFFEPLPEKEHARLVQAMVAAVKPSNKMTPVEWAEYQVLEAAFKLEGLKMDLLYVRCANSLPQPQRTEEK